MTGPPGRNELAAEPPSFRTYDRLVLAIVQDQDAGVLSAALNEAGFPHTRIGSAGGFLRVTNAVFMVAIRHTRFEELAGLIRAACQTRTELMTLPWNVDVDYMEPLEVEVGGATLFVFELERVERL